MNVKVTVTLPLAIILFVSGIYCPSTEENVFPHRYPLQHCISNSAFLQLRPSDSSYEITRSDRNPRKYSLIQTLTSGERKYHFKRAHVDFVSMRDAELRMVISPYELENNTWKLDCVYPSIELARTFYKDITRERPDELLHFLRVVSLRDADNIVLVDRPNIFVNCFGHYATIVMKNADGDVVLIFPASVIGEITQSGTAELSVEITRSFNRNDGTLYKFVCRGDSDATALRELLCRLKRFVGDTSILIHPRPYGDSIVENLFVQLEQQILHRLPRLYRQSVGV